MIQQPIKYTYIDSCRGYAVLMVLCHHIYMVICHNNKSMLLSNLWVQCRMGVMLFFMISALTLFLSLEQKIQEENFPVKNFFIRRFFRIVPLFYVVIAGYLISNKYSLLTIASTFTFTNGFIPSVMINSILIIGWTLSIEMAFYIILPALFKFIKSINGALILFLITLVFSIISKYLVLKYFSIYYAPSFLITYVYFWLPAQLPVFSIGIILYFILFKTDLIDNEEHIFKKYFGYFLMFSGIYFFIVSSYAIKLFITENIAFSFILMLFIWGNAIKPSSIFNNSLIRFLGKISYGFYLLHMIVISIFMNLTTNLNLGDNNMRFIIGFIVVLIGTSILSYITYLVIEQPFQKLGSRIIKRLESNKAISELTI